jgi:hypothetical protein
MRGIKHRTTMVLFGFLGLLATSGALLGSTYVIQQSVLYPFQSTIEINEEFLGGSNNPFPFSVSGGAGAPVAAVANRYGITRRDTTAVINTVATLFMSSGSTAYLPTTPHAYTWAVRLNTNDADTVVRVGEGEDPTANPPAAGLYIEKLGADTNWFCVSRNAGAQTRIDSGVAITTSFVTLSMTFNASGAQFAINNVNVCGLITTNNPSTGIRSFLHIINPTAAAVKSIDYDYFQLRLFGLAR